MNNLILSPIDADVLINRIAEKTALILRGQIPTIPEPSNPDEYLTPTETADRLRISKVTLWRYEKAGKIQCYGIGGKRLYKRSDVENALTLKK